MDYDKKPNALQNIYRTDKSDKKRWSTGAILSLERVSSTP